MSDQQIPNDPLAKKVLYSVVAVLLLTVLILLKFLFNTIDKNSTEGVINPNAKTENLQFMASYASDELKHQLLPIGRVKAGKKVAPGEVAIRSGKEVYDAICTTCHASGVAGAPKFGDKATWEGRVANGIEPLIQSVTDGKGAMPPRAGNSKLKDIEIYNAIIYLVAESGYDLGKEKTAENDKKVAEKEATPAPANKEQSTISPEILAKGKGIYTSACFVCHDSGAANAPKLTDKEAWVKRIEQGKTDLYNSAINGKIGAGVMPPKGGQMQLSDDDVKAAVDYMVNQSSQ